MSSGNGLNLYQSIRGPNNFQRKFWYFFLYKLFQKEMSLLPEFLFLECFLTVCFERHISHYLNHIVGYANASNSEESKFQKEIICYKNISCMIHTKICYYVYFCYICSYKEFRQVSNKQRKKTHYN